LYAILIGKWAYIIIAIAAFTTMFSTIITCLDAFPRSLHEATLTLIPSPKFKPYIIYLILLVLGSQIIVYGFLQNMKQMVDFATTVSFLTTPLLAWLNFKAVERDKVPMKPMLIIWSKLSLILLLSFAGYYLWLII
jgi:multisubunit Na+/H+ antiporter MnhG subunit